MKYERILKFSIAVGEEENVFISEFIKNKLSEIKEDYLKIKIYYKIQSFEKTYTNLSQYNFDIISLLEKEAIAFYNNIQKQLPIVIHVEIYKIVEERKFNIFNFKGENFND